MERYTIITDGYYAVDNDVCYEDQDERYCGPAVDRLAEYEGTGLTPDEVRAIHKFFNERTMKEFDHLSDLLAAEAEGRLVVLPCKTGDTVYQLTNKRHAKGQGVAPRIVSSICVWSDGHYALCHQGMTYCQSNELGKKWFLTREEAEAALAKYKAMVGA